MSIVVTVELPEEIVEQLRRANGDISRKVLESVALEGYRSGELSAYQVMQLLGFKSRMEVEGFLKDHEVFDYTQEDLDQDRTTLDRLLSQ